MFTNLHLRGRKYILTHHTQKVTHLSQQLVFNLKLSSLQINLDSKENLFIIITIKSGSIKKKKKKLHHH